MNVRLRMYEYCNSNLDAIYAKGLYSSVISESLQNIFACQHE